LIEKIQHLIVQEGRRVPSAIHQPVVASRRIFAGAMFASTGSHCNCVDFTVPEINRIVLYIDFAGVQTIQPHRIAVFSNRIDKCHKTVRNVSALAPQFVRFSSRTKLTQAATFFAVFDK
jgi:hypothetical protein